MTETVLYLRKKNEMFGDYLPVVAHGNSEHRVCQYTSHVQTIEDCLQVLTFEGTVSLVRLVRTVREAEN